MMDDKDQLIHIEARIIEAQALEKEKRQARVTVIRGGASTNGYHYGPGALLDLASRMNGAQAYADHNTSAPVRSMRDLVGFYNNASYIAPDEHDPDGRVEADLHVLASADWLWSIIQEAHEQGIPGLLGLSVDFYGDTQPIKKNGRSLSDVTHIRKLNSCDIVTRPSAGGRVQHILQSEQGDPQSMDPENDPQNPGQAAAGTQTPPATPPQNGSAGAAANPPTNPPANAQGEHVQEWQAEFNEQVKRIREQADQQMQAIKLEKSKLYLSRRILECNLPGPVKAKIEARFKDRIFEEAELDAEIEGSRQMMAQLAATNIVRDHGYAVTQGEQVTEAEKIQAAFDLMMGVPVADKYKGVRGFSSIRDAYTRVTGDGYLSAGISGRSELGNIRIDEAAPMGRITEADTTTATFSYLLGTSMNKRLLKDYAAWPAEWMKFVTIVPIKDFKQQTRVRLGAFGSLSTVPEDTAYTTISLQDTAATYVPTKRGNLVTVSRETIVNDDLMAIRQIPTKLAVAAAYTLAEFVYAFLSTNPNIYDGSALFTSGAPHSNLGASALSTAAMQAGVTAMREQTNMAGKRIGLRPKYLIVPAELEFVAMVATKSAGVPGSTNNDINPMLGYVEPIIAPQLSNTTQWFFAADPQTVDTIEIGFVGGQVNPALFIQDQPLYGLNFTQDVISYKIRHEYGGAAVDYRGLYRGI